MDEPDCVHPPHGSAQLAKYAAQDRLCELRMGLRRRNQIEELATGNVLEHEQVVRRRAERVYVRHDRRMRYMLRKLNISKRNMRYTIRVQE